MKVKFSLIGKPVKNLVHTESQVAHVIYDFCKENGIQIQSISQIVNIEATKGDTIDHSRY